MLLGRSWSALGRVLGALGRSWRSLGRILGALGSILKANWEAKRVQNLAQEAIRAENGKTLIFDDNCKDFVDF